MTFNQHAVSRPKFTLQTAIVCLVLFFLTFSFCSYLSEKLPQDGGPDEAVHIKAIRFIDNTHRLAVYPDDLESVYITRFGTTRSFRPPMYYISAVVLSNLFEKTEKDYFYSYRKVSSVFAGLTLVMVFLSGFYLLGSIRAALLAPSLLLVWPQFAMLGSYVNDDIAVCFVVSLMTLSVIKMYRDPGWFNTCLLGLACGLVVISKPTAWGSSLVLALSVLFITTLSFKELIKRVPLVLMLVILGGGWWIIRNMIVHGIDDPLNVRLVFEIIEKYQVDFSLGEGFRAKGVSYWELWLNKYNFLVVSFQASVGMLGWAFVPISNLTYAFFSVIFGLGFLFIPFAVVRLLMSQMGLRYALMLMFFGLALLVQFAGYTYLNFNNDVQIQGKYLLPAVPLVLLLFSAWFAKPIWANRNITAPHIGRKISPIIILMAVFIYAYTWVNDVFPFYVPDAFKVESSDVLRELDLNSSVVSLNNLIRSIDEPEKFNAIDHDAQIILNELEFDAESEQLLVLLSSYNHDKANLYWTKNGEEWTREQESTWHYRKGRDINLIFDFPDQQAFNQLRLDPMQAIGDIYIYRIAVIKKRSKIERVFNYLFSSK